MMVRFGELILINCDFEASVDVFEEDDRKLSCPFNMRRFNEVDCFDERRWFAVMIGVNPRLTEVVRANDATVTIRRWRLVTESWCCCVKNN